MILHTNFWRKRVLQRWCVRPGQDPKRRLLTIRFSSDRGIKGQGFFPQESETVCTLHCIYYQFFFFITHTEISYSFSVLGVIIIMCYYYYYYCYAFHSVLVRKWCPNPIAKRSPFFLSFFSLYYFCFYSLTSNISKYVVAVYESWSTLSF